MAPGGANTRKLAPLMCQPHGTAEPRAGRQKVLPGGADELGDRAARNGGGGPPSGGDAEIAPQTAPAIGDPGQVVQAVLVPGHVHQFR